jgi:hypothetical protein
MPKSYVAPTGRAARSSSVRRRPRSADATSGTAMTYGAMQSSRPSRASRRRSLPGGHATASPTRATRRPSWGPEHGTTAVAGGVVPVRIRRQDPSATVTAGLEVAGASPDLWAVA